MKKLILWEIIIAAFILVVVWIIFQIKQSANPADASFFVGLVVLAAIAAVGFSIAIIGAPAAVSAGSAIVALTIIFTTMIISAIMFISMGVCVILIADEIQEKSKTKIFSLFLSQIGVIVVIIKLIL